MLELRVLGPLEVVRDGEPVPLPRQMHRALLALLVLHRNEVVSTDSLIEELWSGQPPATAKDALQNYVSQLRKAIGRDVIVTRAPGYVLQVEAHQTDTGQFEQLVAEARAAEDPETRAATLRAALALWRGPALADLAYESFVSSTATRLEDLRAAAQEDLVDAELALGHHADLVPRLEELVDAYPYDERARAQLMLALYRAGRQADALEAFREARQTLADELGLDPSPALRELERAILLQEPSLVSPDGDAPAAAERRKTVTVLAVELSPAPEQDPERFRESLVHGITVARAAIERHEGWVTARSEDELLGIFGVPVVHEDDALRACRAATELRDAAGEQPIVVRLAVESGDVVTGHGFVTGDVLRSTARAARDAAPGDVLVGARAIALVRHAVEGRGGTSGFSLDAVSPTAPVVVHHASAPLVGRGDELAGLRERFERATQAGRCAVVVVVGEPGIGKSRLVSELVRVVADEATVVTGQCVSYGEGAAYAPLREIVGAIDLDRALADVDDRQSIEEGVSDFLEGRGSVDEGFWAIRRLLESLAGSRPLVVVLEDLHWVEPRLLDLVDQLVERARQPMLVVGAARPELLDERPAWQPWSLALDRLSDDDIGTVVASLESGLEISVRARLVELAEGNVLLAEQLLAYAEERGEAALETVPPSVEALLAARLDLLDAEVRDTAQRAALIGRDFSRQALAALTPAAARQGLSTQLLDLVRRGLVHPELVTDAEEPFRFHHALVRDVAYAGLPKAARAELHETYADWLLEQEDAADEVVGFHLEQAYRYRTELAPTDRRAKQLASDAGTALGRAGMREWKRSDVAATINLLGRATTLLPPRESQRELLCELGIAFISSGQTENAEAALNSAERTEQRGIQLWARMELARRQLNTNPTATATELLELAQAAIPALEAVGDDRALGRAWLLAGFVQGGIRGRHSEWLNAAEEALVHYRRADWPVATCVQQIAAALYYGSTPVPEAISRCSALLKREAHESYGEANILVFLGGLEAMAGHVEVGQATVDRAATIYLELGHASSIASWCGNFREYQNSRWRPRGG